jgi:hypothetical protein
MDPIIKLNTFTTINLNDPFFDSLRADYAEFDKWFEKKAAGGSKAYIVDTPSGLDGFLHLKNEEEALTDVVPNLAAKKRLKIATFKINPHGTKLGERFLKKIFDIAIHQDLTQIYVTVFSKHNALVELFKKYGFEKCGVKTTINGVEDVYLKDFEEQKGTILLDYPMLKVKNVDKYLLSIFPQYHTDLFPESILNSESYDMIKDVSHTNSIEKVYICFMDLSSLKEKDILVIYRTKDDKGAAWYRSVVTSICTVEEIRKKESFGNLKNFLEYCEKYSVFNRSELENWYNEKKRLYVIKMVYNAAFSKKITRKHLIEKIGLNEQSYWGFMKLSENEFNQIKKDGQIYESIVIN